MVAFRSCRCPHCFNFITLSIILILIFFPERVTGSVPVNPHVCVIGAGISGATAAFFLSRSSSPSITVFEKQSTVGGRVQVLRLPDTPPIEAGASIIAEENALMKYFVNQFNLTRHQKSFGTMGLWNGSKFVFRTHATKARTMFSLLRRYKLSVPATEKYVHKLLKEYKKLYPKNGVQSKWTPYASVQSLLERADGLFNLTQVSFDSVAKNVFSEQYLKEMVAAITRVNYGQDIYQMNGMSGAVALAGSGQDLWAVQGGNYQVVEKLLDASHTNLNLGVEIEHIAKVDNAYELHSGKKKWMCDAVILATPVELTSMGLPSHIAKKAEANRKFQLTVATFIRGSLNKATFGKDPPAAVLTTDLVDDSFTSVGIVHKSENEKNPIFKVFSRKNLTASDIDRIFEGDAEVLASFPWMAYPQFAPPEHFAGFDLDEHGIFIYTSPSSQRVLLWK
ncbi:Farnesylcysteine lyase [Gracilariopsis chorda]|uniref:Farnesylcysteine lyase n=1 Tax=Gracilariopsis chorda TaxID=448386 RepID=A0A2V3IY63_9FLOR|nr:Farnesylcysteine lyase [Gracilariopsis chorda]|eukprot:PXF47096.1 Farnesylcysteine lyase [Gracilariopsis chorda]